MPSADDMATLAMESSDALIGIGRVGGGPFRMIDAEGALIDGLSRQQGDLRARIRAGILVGERRWTLKMTNGLDVKLPENDPEGALAQFARIARDARMLDKDLVSIDLRVPGRIYARLTEEAAATRAEALARNRKKGAPA
jgi:cell division protein FtsQ